jgi:2-polyprenyl-3-methyl-5-hydroxy-6-metoxy-1,4-benzoquinol methylase
VADGPLEDLLTRLERERLDADRLYNDALTALDRALVPAPDLPEIPAAIEQGPLARLNQCWDILPSGPPSTDRSIRGRVRALVWRLAGPPIEAQRRLNADLVDHLNRHAAAHEALRQAALKLVDAFRDRFEALTRFEALLVQYLQTITVYVDSKDRRLATSELRDRIESAEHRLAVLGRRVDQAGVHRCEPVAPSSGREVSQGPMNAHGMLDSLAYVSFENRFRGSREEIRARSGDYAELLAGSCDVLDVGCGRGELLDLLREKGISALGIDSNAAMVELCRARGLSAQQADALAFLRAQEDGSFGGLVAVQVIEHFEPDYLVRFLEAAFRTMRPQAPLILETINPACWMAFFECYLRDLTHKIALHPDTLRHLVQTSGFTRVDVQLRHPVREADRLPRMALDSGTGHVHESVASVAAALNAQADALNARLFSSMDYVVVARR